MCAGLHAAAWVSLFVACHSFVMGNPVRHSWPDDRTVLKQPAVVVMMFDVVTEELLKEQEAMQKERDSRQQRN